LGLGGQGAGSERAETLLLFDPDPRPLIPVWLRPQAALERVLTVCPIALKGHRNSAQGKRSDALGELAPHLQALKGRRNRVPDHYKTRPQTSPGGMFRFTKVSSTARRSSVRSRTCNNVLPSRTVTTIPSRSFTGTRRSTWILSYPFTPVGYRVRRAAADRIRPHGIRKTIESPSNWRWSGQSERRPTSSAFSMRASIPPPQPADSG